MVNQNFVGLQSTLITVEGNTQHAIYNLNENILTFYSFQFCENQSGENTYKESSRISVDIPTGIPNQMQPGFAY